MIICSDCGGNSSVRDSRPVQGTVRRRRYCDDCGAAWTTFEVSREAILKLREANRLVAAIKGDVAELTLTVSAIDELEGLASTGRGPSVRKRQLKPRKTVADIVSEIAET